MDDRGLIRTIAGIVGEDTISDDCAVFDSGGKSLVLSTDMLHEKTDFPEGMTDWQAGWMAVAVTLSDIAAMGAAPALVLLAVGLDREERLAGIMEGAHACCLSYGADLAGGDIDHHDELTLVSTGLGICGPAGPVRRAGCCPGDLICITGTPGCAQAGLEGDFSHLEKLLEPHPRVQEGQALAEAGASSMMDVSDGLALSLWDMQAANPECGFLVDSSALPLPEGIAGEKAKEYALYGGGDFELLFCCPPARLPVEGVSYTVIGTVTGVMGVFCDERPLAAKGYLHCWEDSL